MADAGGAASVVGDAHSGVGEGDGEEAEADADALGSEDVEVAVGILAALKEGESEGANFFGQAEDAFTGCGECREAGFALVEGVCEGVIEAMVVVPSLEGDLISEAVSGGAEGAAQGIQGIFNSVEGARDEGLGLGGRPFGEAADEFCGWVGSYGLEHELFSSSCFRRASS